MDGFLALYIFMLAAFTGHEMQILEDHDLAKPEKWSTGALYDVVAATRNMSRMAGSPSPSTS